jgi:cell wall-associated NlpC family hydrolase
MKRFIFYIFFIIGLACSNTAGANVSIKNAEGVIITFLEAVQNTISQEVLLQAMSLEGTKYKLGGNSPETGFDCSGFVNYVFNQAANVKLPRTTGGLSRVGQSVDLKELQPGDLVFFNTMRRSFSHVGIYIGDGDFIHAPRSGRTVTVENMETGYWHQHFNGAKRIDEIATSEVAAN